MVVFFFHFEFIVRVGPVEEKLRKDNFFHCHVATMIRNKALWIKKWTKLRLSNKYNRIRLPALNFGFELLYMKGSKYQKPREDWSRAFLRHVLTVGNTGRTGFWSISQKDFFLPELSAILLWVSLDFQRPWHLSSQEIKKDLPKDVCFWNMTHGSIHYSLDSGCWLFQPLR